MQEINLITQRLESAGIPYCIVGGLAAIAYGRPRLTLDADLVLAMGPGHIKALVSSVWSGSGISSPEPHKQPGSRFAQARYHY